MTNFHDGKEQANAKKRLAGDQVKSDSIVELIAVQEWFQNGKNAGFARQEYLSHETLCMISRVREDFMRRAENSNFPEKEVSRVKESVYSYGGPTEGPNSHSLSAAIINYVLCPKIGTQLKTFGDGETKGRLLYNSAGIVISDKSVFKVDKYWLVAQKFTEIANMKF